VAMVSFNKEGLIELLKETIKKLETEGTMINSGEMIAKAEDICLGIGVNQYMIYAFTGNRQINIDINLFNKDWRTIDEECKKCI
jgi:hypothetical protein